MATWVTQSGTISSWTGSVKYTFSLLVEWHFYGPCVFQATEKELQLQQLVMRFTAHLEDQKMQFSNTLADLKTHVQGLTNCSTDIENVPAVALVSICSLESCLLSYLLVRRDLNCFGLSVFRRLWTHKLLLILLWLKLRTSINMSHYLTQISVNFLHCRWRYHCCDKLKSVFIAELYAFIISSAPIFQLLSITIKPFTILFGVADMWLRQSGKWMTCPLKVVSPLTSDLSLWLCRICWYVTCTSLC